MQRSRKKTKFILPLVGLLLSVSVAPAVAQQRGQWLSGLAADNSGVMPEPGITYSNIFYYDSSTRLKGPNGAPIQVNGQFAIMADNNIFHLCHESQVSRGKSRFCR